MKKFKEYIDESAVATQRVGIEHIDKLTPIKFLALMNTIQKYHGKKLTKDKISITEKIDGTSLRFGIDDDGSPFIESSHSGPITKSGQYTKWVKSKGYGPSPITKGFESLFRKVRTDNKLIAVLQKYMPPEGIKVIGELLYSEFAKYDGDKVRFVYIDYDKKNLGTDWTFVPFQVLNAKTLRPIRNKKQFLNALYKISTAERKYIAPTVNIDMDIDITMEFDEIAALSTKYDNLEDLLKSRKLKDRDIKNNIKDQIQNIQKNVAKSIVSAVKRGVFGSEFEGIVVELRDGTKFKVVTSTFKDRFTKEEYIIEKRRNPEMNPRLGTYEELRQYKDDPDIYISFTEIEKIGINPHSGYNTPLAVYTYPLKEIWPQFDHSKKRVKVPYAGDNPWIYVLRKNCRRFIEDIGKGYSSTDWDRDVEQGLYKMYRQGKLFINTKRLYSMESRDNPETSRFVNNILTASYEIDAKYNGHSMDRTDNWVKNLEPIDKSKIDISDWNERIKSGVKGMKQSYKSNYKNKPELDKPFLGLMGNDFGGMKQEKATVRLFMDMIDKWNEMVKDIHQKEPTPEVFRKFVNKAIADSRDKSPGGLFFNLTRWFSTQKTDGSDYSVGIQSITLWNKIFRDLGICGIADKSGKGIIHPAEPTQAIFFSKDAFKVVDKIRNRVNESNVNKITNFKELHGLLMGNNPVKFNKKGVMVGGKELDTTLYLELLNGKMFWNIFRKAKNFKTLNNNLEWSVDMFVEYIMRNNDWGYLLPKDKKTIDYYFRLVYGRGYNKFRSQVKQHLARYRKDGPKKNPMYTDMLYRPDLMAIAQNYKGFDTIYKTYDKKTADRANKMRNDAYKIYKSYPNFDGSWAANILSITRGADNNSKVQKELLFHMFALDIWENELGGKRMYS